MFQGQPEPGDLGYRSPTVCWSSLTNSNWSQLELPLAIPEDPATRRQVKRLTLMAPYGARCDDGKLVDYYRQYSDDYSVWKGTKQ
jgi:hypothetical protein